MTGGYDGYAAEHAAPNLLALASVHGPDTTLPEGHRFPRFMLLAFSRA